MASTRRAISSPLDGSATTSKPLNVTLDLSSLIARVSSGDQNSYDDIFDRLDAQTRDITTTYERADSAEAQQSDPSSTRGDALPSPRALADSTALYFPCVAQTCQQWGKEKPPWLEQVGGKVTALAAARTSSLGKRRRREPDVVSEAATVLDTRIECQTQLRVAVGVEDGTLWLFGPPESPPAEIKPSRRPAAPHSPPTLSPSSRQTSFESFRVRSPPLNGASAGSVPPSFPSSTASPVDSPPESPRIVQPRPRHASIGTRAPPQPPPPLGHRKSSASIPTRRSISGVRTPINGAGGIDVSHGASSRLRKASATVSVTTAGGATELGSQPMSPTSSRSTVDAAIPTSPQAPQYPSNAVPSVVLSSPTPSRSSRQAHSKARDSITTGIGLWETESASASVSAAPVTSSDAYSVEEEQDERGALDSPGQGEDEAELEKLEPVAKVRIAGSGSIVAAQVVESSRYAAGEKDAVAVLRKHGHLSLHSLVDGRCLVACDATMPSNKSSPTAALAFKGMKQLQVADSSLALCYSGDGFVVVDLDSLQVSRLFEQAGNMSEPAIIFRQGVHFLVFATQASLTSEDSPEMLVRPIFLQDVASDPPVNGKASSPPLSHEASHEPRPLVAARLEAAHSVGKLEGLRGTVRGMRSCADDLLAFDENSLVLFSIREQQVVHLAQVALDDIVDVCVNGYNSILVVTRSKAVLYRLDPTTHDGGNLFTFAIIDQVACAASEASLLLPPASRAFPSAHEFLVVTSSPKSRQISRLTASNAHQPDTIREGFVLPDGQSSSTLSERELYRCPREAKVPEVSRVTSVVRHSRDCVVLGFNSGEIRRVQGRAMLGPHIDSEGTLVARLTGAITLLEVVDIDGHDLLVAGTASGTAGAWLTEDWTQLGSWNLFASPIFHVATCSTRSQVDASAATLIFISANSPVALVAVQLSDAGNSSSIQLVLPGTRSPVESISTHVEKEEVMVIYEQGLARICHLGSRELRRSMERKTAQQVLAEGGWQTWFSLLDKHRVPSPMSTFTAPTLSIDLRLEVDETVQQLPWSGESRRRKIPASASVEATTSATVPRMNGTQGESPGLEVIRVLLACLASFGIDVSTDALMEEHLSVSRPQTGIKAALEAPHSASFAQASDTRHVWTVSPINTAQKLLQIVCLLRVFLNYLGTERYAGQAIVFYASSLQDVVGPEFKSPSLELFAEYWLDRSSEVQQAARSLFGTYLGACSDVDVVRFVERWQDQLPSRLSSASQAPSSSDQALLLTGLVAADKFKLLSATVLKDISTSILSYLDDSSPPYHQAIATELCSRAFETWQHYVDASLLVRQLFGLATGRNPSTPSELRALARHATVHVASVNTPLFMTTLLSDILHAPTAAHRNATLKLLGFMIRKRPLVLYTSLPRIAEAVVKSLDPTITDLRQTVHQAATVILDELVRTYPLIDFHHKSQRLAVGTQEGSSIIYDLRTATRMYVLEGHKRPLTALSWSPDGHRLISVSLEESKVVVWKVGVGILSMFMPGAPPRQGGGRDAGPGAPFKTYDFHVGDEGLMTTAATLEWVVFDWPADRTARLRLRETALNFGC